MHKSIKIWSIKKGTFKISFRYRIYKVFGETFRNSATSLYASVAHDTAAGDEFGCNIVKRNTFKILLSVKCNGTLKSYHCILIKITI